MPQLRSSTRSYNSLQSHYLVCLLLEDLPIVYSSCGYQFCFVCKQKWGLCSVYSCSKFKTVEDQQNAEAKKKEFAPGYRTSSEWLVGHERYVAFSKKQLHAKGKRVRHHFNLI